MGRKWLAIVAAVAMTAGWASGALVVNFDTESGVSGLAARTMVQNQDLDGDSSNDDSYVYFGFNNPGGTAWSSVSGHYALYGGFRGEAFNNNNRNTGDYSMDATNGFYLRYQPNATGETGRVVMMPFFYAAPSPQPYKLTDAGNYLQVSGNSNGAMGRFENFEQARWMVRNGTTFYVSQTSIANTNVGTRTLDSTELASEMWAVLDPASAYGFTIGTLNFNTPTSALNNLNGFGMFLYSPTPSQSRRWIGFTEFRVDATPIPEPGSVGLLLGAGGLLMVMRRRLRRMHAA